MKTWQTLLIGILIGLLAAGLLFWGARQPAGTPILLPTQPPETWTVDVSGAVAHPGLVQLAPGCRVADAIAAAGGLTEQADRAALNLAAPLQDGQQVFVTAVGQPAPHPTALAHSPEATPAGPIDLNTATQEQLETLPAIGASKASAILAYRAEHGPFTDLDQLLQVPGIGEGILAQIRPYLVLGSGDKE